MTEQRHLTLRERTYQELIRMIVAGELPGGSYIDERPLIERLSVSRTPFREAIGTLEKEGLVEIRPYRGHFVRSFTPKEVNDLYEVRKVLECLAVRLVVPTLTEAQIEMFGRLLDDAVDGLMKGDLEVYARLDRTFHETIAELSGNRTLIETLSRLALQIQICRVMANEDPDVVTRTARERDAILAAFRARDADKAAALMEVHIGGVQRSVIERLEAEASAAGQAPATRPRRAK